MPFMKISRSVMRSVRASFSKLFEVVSVTNHFKKIGFLVTR